MRATTTLSNLKTIEGDEKKLALVVPQSRLFMPLVKRKKNLYGLPEHDERDVMRRESCDCVP